MPGRKDNTPRENRVPDAPFSDEEWFGPKNLEKLKKPKKPKKAKEPRAETVIYIDQSGSMGYFPLCAFEGHKVTEFPKVYGSFTDMAPVLEHASRNLMLKRMIIFTDGVFTDPLTGLKASGRGLKRLKKVSVTFLSLYPMYPEEMNHLTASFAELGMKRVKIIGLG